MWTAFLFVALAGAAPARARVPLSPQAVLGFEPGDEGRLASWQQIADYLHVLAAASPRVLLEEVGRTTEGRPFLVATISAEANLLRLEELRQINRRLGDPRTLSDLEAEHLLEQGRVVVALHHGIHATEVAGPLGALQVAHWLASASDPETRTILDRVVVLMIVSQNPDGLDRVVQWRDEWPAFEGKTLPFLDHRFAGHDLNRDWYAFTQAETRLTVDHVFNRWRPQIVHDVHQMGESSARFVLPPYLDPWEPNVDPVLRAAANALGSHIAARLTAEGKSGVAVHARFDAWSPSRGYPFTHGSVRLLSEAATARLTLPVEVPKESLRSSAGLDPKRDSWNQPLPWSGGTWRLRDAVDYQVSATRALLEHAALHREFWLRSFLRVNRRACTRNEPAAFVVPIEQKDPYAAARLLEILRRGDVELHRTTQAFDAGGRSVAAGSIVVLMQQPSSAFAKTVLERQSYPDLQRRPGEPALAPFDATAHTLPLLMGVVVDEVRKECHPDLEPFTGGTLVPGRIEGRGRFFALGHKTGDLIALGRLLAAGVPMRWAKAAFSDGDRVLPAGTLLCPASARSRLAPLVGDLGLLARGIEASPPAWWVRRPRVGLYQSWIASSDEGWTRQVLERDFGLPYRTLHDADIRKGRLSDRFDVIVLPSQISREIVEGHAPGTAPPEYTSGIGRAGVTSLAAFVEAGGTLVALNRACEMAIAELGLPVKNVLEDVPIDTFDGPGSILRVRVETADPIAHGLEEMQAVWFEASPAFEALGGKVVARYVDDEPLLSGWLLGGRHLKDKAALVEVRRGRGRVVLFGFRPQYRGQSWTTYIALLNALYTSATGR